MSIGTNSRRIDWPRVLHEACRQIEQRSPGLAALAASLGVGQAELQRQFSRRLGVSPKGYAQALALHRLVRGANRARSSLDGVLDAGFGTTASAYAATSETLGATPGQLRKPLEVGWWMGLSDLGWMLIGATDRGICWVAFGDQPGALVEDLRAAFPKAHFYNDENRLYDWFQCVREFVLLPREALDLPMDVQGTAFQSRVWRALRSIPLGSTVSYGEVAKRLGQPTAARAVATACARNRIAVLIPCHRVVGVDGRFSGYRWGPERKQQLLLRERSHS